MKQVYHKPAELKQLYSELMPRLTSASTLLELGVRDGHSIRYWLEKLPGVEITGVDVNPAEKIVGATFFQAVQQDTEALERISRSRAPDGWDVIIDDASHIGSYTATSFRYLYPRHLRQGGLYIIEDWRTGYQPDWVDGQPQSLTSAGEVSIRRTKALAALRRAARRWGPHLRRHAGTWRVGSAIYDRLQRTDISITHPSHDAGMVGVVKQIVDLVGDTNDELAVEKMTFTKHAVLIEKPKVTRVA